MVIMDLQALIRNSFLLAFFFGLQSCTIKPKNKIIANADTLTLKTKEGFYYSNKALFTGMLFKLDEKNLDTLLVENYLGGKKHGVFKRFYENNLLLEERTYHNGKKEGLHLRYWPDGKLIFEYHLKNDLYEGPSRSWNQEGRLIQKMNYVAGREIGRQQLWYDDGGVRSNYVIRNNRRYGLLGSKNCVNVSDEIK